MESKGAKRSPDANLDGANGKRVKKESNKEATKRKQQLLKSKASPKCLSKYKVVYLRDNEEDALIVRDVFSETMDYRFGVKGQANAEIVVNGLLYCFTNDREAWRICQ